MLDLTGKLPATLSGPLADAAFWATPHGQQLDALLTQRYSAALLVLQTFLAEGTLKPALNPINPQPYLCAGCSMAEDGAVRTDIVALASCPVLRAWVHHKLGCFLWLVAFHAQAYEPGASPGWGGVIAIHRRTHKNVPDTSAILAAKMAVWVDKDTNVSYEKEEAVAAAQLQAYGKVNFPEALAFLVNANDNERDTAVRQDLQPGVVFWLGQPATRRLLGDKFWTLFGGQWVVSNALLTPEHALQCAKTLTAA
jgi:hypothetical protein